MTQLVAFIRDLAIVMGGALLDIPLLPAAKEEEEDEEGGAMVEEKVTRFEGDVEVLDQQL